MRSGERVDHILALIDSVVPPQDTPEQSEVHELILPQLELIVALSGLERVFTGKNPNINRDYYDTHHLFWPRVMYRSKLEKTFRQQFILPIRRDIHEELHARLEPPAMPSRTAMLGHLALLDKK